LPLPMIPVAVIPPVLSIKDRHLSTIRFPCPFNSSYSLKTVKQKAYLKLTNRVVEQIHSIVHHINLFLL
jgi:hypothetical protein